MIDEICGDYHLKSAWPQRIEIRPAFHKKNHEGLTVKL